MYLIELILKKYFEKNKKKDSIFFEPENQEESLYKNCEKHLYMPIDSTCDFLACKNCGHIIKNSKNLKDKNYKKNQDLYDNF